MAKTKRNLPTYRAYVFKGQDPIVQAFADARHDSKMTMSEVRDAGGPAASTMHNWERGKTMRPQFTTIAAGTKAVGKNIIDLSGKNLVLRHSVK